MIVLDTNTVSELIREHPDNTVITWLDSVPGNELFTTSVTAAELLHGGARLPDGQRKTRLQTAIQSMLDEDFRERVEPFDRRAAVQYAEIVTEREKVGRPISVADAQIAAICRQLQAVLATRNIKDFEHTGVELVNPWDAH